MASILDSVDQRTQLVGENRLELLMFRLGSRQLFAINVFKVREVVKLPHLNKMPGAHHNISGVANIRGTSIPVINLRSAIGMRAMPIDSESNLIITEYNRTIQGFLVGQVAHIVNMTWKDILPPPRSAGRANYLTAITRVPEDGVDQIVEIIDVEKVLAEIITYDIRISEEVLDLAILPQMNGRKVLIVEVIECQDGLEALNLLKGWCDAGKKVTDEILLMITDAEMPEMDGYRLTHEIRSDARMSDLFITLNTSLSGNFNEAMVKKVGCDRFISKFQPDLLVGVAQERLRQILER